jgi:hypothetical protein
MEEKKCFGLYEEFSASCIVCGAKEDCEKHTLEG